MTETEWFEGDGVGGGQDRKTILPLLVWALVIGLVLGAVLYSAKAAAEGTYSTKDAKGNLVRITLEPCPDSPAWLNLHRAEMRYEGVDYLACWLFMAGMVIVLDSNDEATPIPLQAFEKDELI